MNDIQVRGYKYVPLSSLRSMAPLTPSARTPIRRRRFIFFTLLVVVAIFTFGVPWEVPPSLKDGNFQSALSRASIAKLLQSKLKSGPKVDEIYGLLHLVTGDTENEHVLSQTVELDPTKPISLAIYATGNSIDWSSEVDELNEKYPVVVFSKSFCPFSRRAKELLSTYDIHPPPKVIEVDLRDDSNAIKAILTRLTRRSTFPNIIVRGRSIGGSDDIHELHTQKLLGKLLEEAGVVQQTDGAGK